MHKYSESNGTSNVGHTMKILDIVPYATLLVRSWSTRGGEAGLDLFIFAFFGAVHCAIFL